MKTSVPWASRAKKPVTKGTPNGRVARIVIHITGRNLWNKATAKKVDVLDFAENVYTHIGPHYVVAPDGRVRQYRCESIRPVAQGWGKHGGISNVINKPIPRLWTSYWKKVDLFEGYSPVDLNRPPELCPEDVRGSFSTPIDLIAPDRTPNARSIAIEFVQKDNQLLLTPEQYIMGSGLVSLLCDTYKLERSRRNVMGHEDVDPWSRFNSGGGWDPGALRILPNFHWGAMLDTMALPEAIRRGMVYTGEKKIYGGLPELKPQRKG